MGGDGGGGDMGGAPAATGADGAPADQHGTARDFGNMLNSYYGSKKRKHGDKVKSFNPWGKVK